MSILLLFQGWLASIPGRGSFMGELVSQADDYLLVGLIIALLAVKLRGRERISLPYLLPALSFFLVGVTSALLYGGLGFRTALGAYIALKSYAVFLLVVNTEWSDWRERFPNTLLLLSVPILGLALVEVLVPGIRPILGLAPSLDPRMGIVPAQSVFIHPGVLGSFVAYAAIFSFASFAEHGRKRELVLGLLLVAAAVLTLRLKPIIGMAVSLPLLALSLRHLRLRWKPIATALLIAVILLGGLAWQVIGLQVRGYLTESSATSEARNILYATGGRIALDRFPLGTGFGTFGSWPSRMQYSPVYDDYGISGVWGLSREHPKFIMDTFWPSVLGETGLVGLAAYSLLLVSMCSAAFRIVRSPQITSRQRVLAIGACFAFVQALVESLGSPMFFQQPTTMMMVLPLGMCWTLFADLNRPAARTPDSQASDRASRPGHDTRPYSEPGGVSS